MSRMKWVAVPLVAAGLVTTERSGRESICTLRTATIAEGHALMLSALGIADPAAWIAPADALPSATPLVDAVRGEEA